MKLLPAPSSFHARRISIAAGLLLLYWIALPVPLSRSSTGPSYLDCLTQADVPPAQDTRVPVLERCAAVLPSDAELLADLGAAYEAAAAFDKAEEIYQRALAIDPQFAEVRRRLAALMRRRGADAEARRQIDAALAVQPNRARLVEAER